MQENDVVEFDGDNFESMRALRQDLTFEEAERAFQEYGVEFSSEKYVALGMVKAGDTLYTNLALLMSDQCPYSIKVAVFADDAKTVFKDNKEFKGSIFKQLEECFQYLMLCNRNALVFDGLKRVEKIDYPVTALREALLNALIHRDYSFSGSIIINVNETTMEIISIGGLYPGLSKDDICNGISQPRNKSLAEVFHRLRLVESYGTGIRKIMVGYAYFSNHPQIIVTENTFKMILPNMNEEPGNIDEGAHESDDYNEQYHVILSYLRSNEFCTQEKVQEILDVKRTRAYLILREMVQKHLIKSEGRGGSKRYYLRQGD